MEIYDYRKDLIKLIAQTSNSSSDLRKLGLVLKIISNMSLNAQNKLSQEEFEAFLSEMGINSSNILNDSKSQPEMIMNSKLFLKSTIDQINKLNRNSQSETLLNIRLIDYFEVLNYLIISIRHFHGLTKRLLVTGISILTMLSLLNLSNMVSTEMSLRLLMLNTMVTHSVTGLVDSTLA